MAVEVTTREEQIFQTLLGAVASCGIGTQMRVAGGWVRDKLLGLESEDIDIALDNGTAKNFRGAILEYLRDNKALTKDGYIVPMNRERSKHLESAVVEIYGERIEFVNLRSAGFRENDEPAVGTPMEDAYRRDLTINSLFYNLSTRRVEDLTGRGVTDLQAGLVKTPLPALTTFLDDPLRVLRAARFASHLRFQLDPELKEAAVSKQIHDALRKVSGERVAEEAKKMLFGNDPVRAMQLLRELGCIDLVFSTPAELALPQDWESSGAERMVAVSELMSALGVSDETVRCVAALASLLLQLQDYTYVCRGKRVPLSTHIIRDRLLYNENVSNEVASLLAAAGNPRVDSWFQNSKSELANGNAAIFEGDVRVQVGLLLKELLELKGARPSFKENSVDAFVAVVAACKCAPQKRITSCKALKAAIVDSGLYKAKCLLNGRDVLKVLGVANGSSHVKIWLHRVFVWQLENVGASASDCEQWIRENRHDGE